MNSNNLVIKQKQKQTNKQAIYIDEDWVSKLSYKIEFFVLYNGHQNCLHKSLPNKFYITFLHDDSWIFVNILNLRK